MAADFVAEYFVNPIKYQSAYAPYNVFNTVIYAAIALVAAYAIYKLLRAKNVKIDKRFFHAVLPFIAFGSILRIFEDADILPRVVDVAGFEVFPFVTPGIYILTFLVLAFCYFLAKLAHKRAGIDAVDATQKLGLMLAGALLVILLFMVDTPLSSVLWLIMILSLSLAAVLVFQLAKKALKYCEHKSGFEDLERVAVFSQMLDGSATFVGVHFLGYSEQHLLANALFGLAGTPFIFYVAKLLFVMLVILVLRREAENESEHVYLLLLITIFGLAPGLRDALQIALGV